MPFILTVLLGAFGAYRFGTAGAFFGALLGLFLGQAIRKASGGGVTGKSDDDDAPSSWNWFFDGDSSGDGGDSGGDGGE